MEQDIQEIMQKPNVVGCSRSKLKEGILNVYVTKKVPEYELKKKDIVPKVAIVEVLPLMEAEVETDVIEIGEIVAYEDRASYKPLKGGCEISPKGSNWVGTLGCKVYKVLFGKKKVSKNIVKHQAVLEKYGLAKYLTFKEYGLTNAHVTQQNVLEPKIGIEILQPYGRRQIGIVEDTVKLFNDHHNKVDASIIKLTEEMKDEVITIGEVKGSKAEVKIGEPYKKYGRTTGYASGKLIDTDVTVSVNYGSAGKLTFDDALLFEAFSAGGDSGSAILDSDNYVIGLLFAGSDKVTVGIPIKSVEAALDVII